MNPRCAKCDLNPCACRYIITLGRGGQWSSRRAEALKMWDEPLPTVDGRETYHYSTCPCPKCHSLRLSTFAEYPNVVPLPLSPTRLLRTKLTEAAHANPEAL